MNAKLEHSIQKEIRRRAFERAEIKQRDREQTQLTLAALEEVTGLSGEELQAIAAEVRAQYDVGRDKFLSIPSQVLILLAALVSLALFFWLLL